MQDFPLLDNFPEQPVMAPVAVAWSSPTGLAPAPASPLRPTSPSRQPYSSSSAVPTPAGRAGPSGVVRASTRYNVDYPRLERKIKRMIRSEDAEGIIRLSKEDYSRLPVLKELRWQLLRRPGERRPEYATRELAPSIKQSDLESLANQAVNNGTMEKAQFYARLRTGFTEENRKRLRKD